MNQPILNQLIVDAPKTKTIWPQLHTSHFLQRAILSGGIPMNSLYKKVDNHQLPLSAWFPPCLQSCACSKAGFFAEPESTMAANPNSLEAQNIWKHQVTAWNSRNGPRIPSQNFRAKMHIGCMVGLGRMERPQHGNLYIYIIIGIYAYIVLYSII